MSSLSTPPYRLTDGIIIVLLTGLLLVITDYTLQEPKRVAAQAAVQAAARFASASAPSASVGPCSQAFGLTPDGEVKPIKIDDQGYVILSIIAGKYPGPQAMEGAPYPKELLSEYWGVLGYTPFGPDQVAGNPR